MRIGYVSILLLGSTLAFAETGTLKVKATTGFEFLENLQHQGCGAILPAQLIGGSQVHGQPWRDGQREPQFEAVVGKILEAIAQMA